MGISSDGKRAFDPVLRAQNRRGERDVLIGFLKKHLEHSFSPSELTERTSIPKQRVRDLLDTSDKISVVGHGDRYLFQSRPPKRKRQNH